MTQQIEGQPITFNENAATDEEVLCYYAYSALYQGDPTRRKELLKGRCDESCEDLFPNIVARATFFTKSQTTLPGGEPGPIDLSVSDVGGSAQVSGTKGKLNFGTIANSHVGINARGFAEFNYIETILISAPGMQFQTGTATVTGHLTASTSLGCTHTAALNFPDNATAQVLGRLDDISMRGDRKDCSADIFNQQFTFFEQSPPLGGSAERQIAFTYGIPFGLRVGGPIAPGIFAEGVGSFVSVTVGDPDVTINANAGGSFTLRESDVVVENAPPDTKVKFCRASATP